MRGSYVLRAIGVPEEDAHSSIRFGLGRGNAAQDIDRILDRLVRSVARLREMSPLHHASTESGDRDHVV